MALWSVVLAVADLAFEKGGERLCKIVKLTVFGKSFTLEN